MHDLGGGNSKIFRIFTPILGEMMQFNEFLGWVVQPPTSNPLAGGLACVSFLFFSFGLGFVM